MKKLIFALFLVIPLLAQSTIWRVDGMGDSTADFVSLQDAIDNASSGDTIYVLPTFGDYGDIEVDKSLIIIGTGYLLADNDSTQRYSEGAKLESITFVSGSEGSELQGFELTGSTGRLGFSGQNLLGAIILDACCIRIERCKISDSFSSNDITLTWNADNCRISQCLVDRGNILFESSLPSDSPSPGVSGLIVSNSVFKGYKFSNVSPLNPSGHANVASAIFDRCVFFGGSAQTLNIDAVNTTFLNSIFLGTSDTDYNGGGSTFQNCLTLGTGLTTGSNNQNNVLLENLFDITQENNVELRYTLSENSPAKNFAIDGGDCGIFGGSNPYVLSGMPNIPSIFELNVATYGDGTSQTLDVNLKAKSHE